MEFFRRSGYNSRLDSSSEPLREKDRLGVDAIMDTQTRQVIREFVQRMQAIYGDRLKRVLMYGSCARGEATADSDIDLAVVLAGDVAPGKEIDRMIDAITDINLEYGVLLSVYPVSEDNYQKLNSPLLMNIRREGVAV